MAKAGILWRWLKPAPFPKRRPAPALREIMGLIRTLCELVSSSVSYPTGESPSQGFMRNFIWDTKTQDEHQLFVDAFLRMSSYVNENSQDPSCSVNGDSQQPSGRPHVSQGVRELTQLPEWSAFVRIQNGGDTKEIFNTLLKKLVRRTFFTTKEGYMGIAQRPVEAGDTLVLLAGLRIPVITRKAGDNNYLLQSSVMVHGLMYGEAWPDDTSQLQALTLV